MWLLKVKVDGKSLLLHDGKYFIGTNDEKLVEKVAVENSAKIVSAGGYEALEVKTDEELKEMVGGVPYTILNVSGGLIPFYGVEIVKEKSHDTV